MAGSEVTAGKAAGVVLPAQSIDLIVESGRFAPIDDALSIVTATDC